MSVLCFRDRASGNAICFAVMFLKYEFSHIIIQVYLNYRFESFCMKKFQSSIISTKQVIISAQYYFSLQSAKNNLMTGL